MEKKGNDIVRIDLRKNKNPMADYLIVCTGESDRHARALAESVEETIFKKTGLAVNRKEGIKLSEWVLLDYFDVIVHIFLREKREFYGLEELWGDAEIEKVSP